MEKLGYRCHDSMGHMHAHGVSAADNGEAALSHEHVIRRSQPMFQKRDQRPTIITYLTQYLRMMGHNFKVPRVQRQSAVITRGTSPQVTAGSIVR